MAMRFSATIEEEFCMALGVGVGLGEGGEHATGSGGAGRAVARGCEGRRDPRALVVMAYALVLLVLCVELFPKESEEAYVGESVYGVLGG